MAIPVDISRRFGVSNVVIPKEGPISVPVVLDFSADGTAELQGLLITQSEAISQIQGVYIDNADNPEALTLTVNTTRQRIIAPANSQGFYSLMTINPPDMVAETVALSGLQVTLIFYNVPIQSEAWSALPGGGVVGLTDAQLRLTPVPVVTTGLAYTNRSIVNLSGASEVLMGANANRKVLIVVNEGATAVAINLLGGAAALNTAGNITLAAGGNIVLDNNVPVSAITVIGTANADITAFEG